MAGISRAAVFGLAAFAFSASASIAGAAAKGPLDGVWTIARVVTTGANAATTSSPQSSVIIFDQGYYAYVSGGNEPRKAAPAAANPDKLTDAEKLA
jgi:hypothetical protein